MALLAPGARLSRYTILQKLATGNMAEVYLAEQRGPVGFTKQVVLKVLLPHLAADLQLVQMFHNEAKLAALLNHHGIVQIHDLGVEGATHFIAMEHIDGVSLRRVINRLAARRRRMRRHLALRIAIDACWALHHAHNLTGPGGRPLEIIHRDVSLENIMVSYAGEVKLVDFGIAKARTLESYTGTGALTGKVEYLPPEVLEGQTPDHRVDVYAMGVVLYLLLLGRAPFVGHNEVELIDRILVDPPPAPCKVDPDLPKQLERIVLKALRKDRNRRYQTARQLALDLNSELKREGAPRAERDLGSFVLRLIPPDTEPSAVFPTPRESETHIEPTNPSAMAPALGKDRISDILERAPNGSCPSRHTPTERVAPGPRSSFDAPDTVPDSPPGIKSPDTEPDLPTNVRPPAHVLPPDRPTPKVSTAPADPERTPDQPTPKMSTPPADPEGLPTRPLPAIDPDDPPTDPLPPGVDPALPSPGEDPEEP